MIMNVSPSTSEATTVAPIMPLAPEVIVTAKAAQKVYTLLAEEQDFDLKLRVYIEGGGCSGLQYCFTFDGEERPHDRSMSVPVLPLASQKDDVFSAEDLGLRTTYTIPDNSQIIVVIDYISHPLLAGATIDYVIDATGQHFAVTNPNASASCGCGASFAA